MRQKFNVTYYEEGFHMWSYGVGVGWQVNIQGGAFAGFSGSSITTIQLYISSQASTINYRTGTGRLSAALFFFFF